VLVLYSTTAAAAGIDMFLLPNGIAQSIVCPEYLLCTHSIAAVP
jgi:hypothetical protein